MASEFGGKLKKKKKKKKIILCCGVQRLRVIKREVKLSEWRIVWNCNTVFGLLVSDKKKRVRSSSHSDSHKSNPKQTYTYTNEAVFVVVS